MTITINRRWIALGLGLAIPALLLASAAITRVSAQPPAGDELAGNSKQFKNIRVLKNVPAKQIIPMMHVFNDSLGVGCEFCHVVGPDHKDFWRDDKPTKTTARGMITMAQDINRHQKIIRGKGTCYMCHHGKEVPELTPPGAAERR